MDETTIAVELVEDKTGENPDDQNDPIVRIEAINENTGVRITYNPLKLEVHPVSGETIAPDWLVNSVSTHLVAAVGTGQKFRLPVRVSDQAASRAIMAAMEVAAVRTAQQAGTTVGEIVAALASRGRK